MKTRKLQNTPQLQITIKKVYIWAGISIVVVLLTILTFNLMIQKHGVAADSPKMKKYGFDVAAPELKKVNFTVLDNSINSMYDEVRPYISGDGNRLYFGRRKYPENIFGKKDEQDIWIIELNDEGTKGTPKNLGDRVNTRGMDAICSISPDGREMIMISEDLKTEYPLLKTTLFESGWSTPIPLKIQNFYSLTGYVDFYLSYEMNVLFMGISREDTYGQQDLYVSFPDGENSWTEPINLGKTINTEKSDFAPFLSSDGKTLYFASYGHEGYGNSDIFKSTRLDDTWTNWSKPINLGKGINSFREESYFTITKDNKYIYFETYDPRHPVRDIFRANLP